MKRKLLVFTDLDGTLLDHESYSWYPATPVLERLRYHHIPLIFNSSKTAAEIATLRGELESSAPFITENGGALVLPAGCLPGQEVDETCLFGRPYAELCEVLADLRRQKGYRFAGFADLGPGGVAEATGLDLASATQACARQCSEPLLWQERGERLIELHRDLAAHRLQLVRGGRFHHVMGETDKGTALGCLAARYRRAFPQTEFVTVALGDGENDLPMLKAADVAVIIPPHEGPPLDLPGHPRVFRPPGAGPYGWRDAMSEILHLHL